MKNVNMVVKGNKLVIELDMSQEFGLSTSGKSIIVSSSEGNQSIPGTDLKIGLNVYRSAKAVKSGKSA